MVANKISSTIMKNYTSKNVNTEDIKHYLDKITVQLISEATKDYLNASIRSEEINKAIDLMKNGKSTGPDGLTSKFSKSLRIDTNTTKE